MTLISAVGQAQALDGREAGLQATHMALNRLGATAPTFGIVIASHQYQPREVAAGVTSLTGEMPLIGFSAPAGLTGEGIHPHSVVVALLSGDLRAEVHWLPGYAQSGRETANRLLQLTSKDTANQSLLFFADGFNGDAEQLCNALPEKSSPIVGGLSSGDLHTGNTYQIAGTQAGTGGLAAAVLRGPTKIGIGSAHGWDPVGSQFRVTRSRGFWLRTLDGRPASETYAQIFGYPARDWAFPPLSYLARLYPLGVEQGEQLILRSPLRVEADGSFRMNAPVRDGLDAYLLIGSRASCQNAAQTATRQALLQLDEAKPVFALILVDIAWQMLLKSTPGAEIAAVQEILGPDVPIAGGYTLGQIVPGKFPNPPQFLNQHMVVIVLGEEQG
jgi:hypothetical protein